MRTGKRLIGATLTSLSLLLAACEPPPPQGSAASANPAAASNPTDADVTANVKAALQREASLQGAAISVETHKGDVRLEGVLDAPEQIERALAAARGAHGTHSVYNRLSVAR
jgi:osmotically-inducible protein OsmY